MAHPPLHELVAEHVQAQRRRGIVKTTIRQRRYKVLALARDVAPRHVLDLTADDIDDWLDTFDIRTSTRVTYLDNLRAFYEFARKAGYITTDPTEDIETPRQGRRLPRPIADEDLADALERADARMLALLSLMAYEGARCVEVSRLRGEDIDVRAMSVTLDGKGDKQRVVPLHPNTLAALRAYRLPEVGPVFIRYWDGHQRSANRPISPSYVSQLVSGFLPRRWTAHQLRHWFGTNFYRLCKDIRLTQEAMGHSRPETTAGYAMADVSQAAAVVNALVIGGGGEQGQAGAA